MTMDGPVNGTEVGVCPNVDNPDHSAASCTWEGHRPAASVADDARAHAADDAEHIVSVDLRTGAFVIEFDERGKPIPTFDVGQIEATRLLSAAAYLHNMGTIIQRRVLATALDDAFTKHAAAQRRVQEAACGPVPGGSRAALRRVEKLNA